MDLSEAFLNTLAGLAGGIAGGVVTGIYTLRATDKAIREESGKELKRDEKEVQNLLDALGVEIKTLWDFHMKRVGGLIESLPEGQALEFYYPLTQDYFTIYNSNAALIGRIPEAALREAIVICYNKCKKVVDGFKYNNELVREYRDAVGAMVHDSRRIDIKRTELITYAAFIKEDHYELKGYVERLSALLANR